jgi:uncharacterized protein DUF3606
VKSCRAAVPYELRISARREPEQAIIVWTENNAPNMSEDYEVAYWSKKWGVTREQLAEAVKKAGPMSAAVAKELGKAP